MTDLTSTGNHPRNVAVDDLNHGQLAIVGHHIEGLRLDIRVLVGTPAQVVPGEHSVGDLFGLLGNRADGVGTVFGLLGASNSGQATR